MMNAMAKKGLSSIGYALEVNYYLALVISLAAAALSLTGNQNFLDTGGDIYNPLLNNLKLMLVYLVLIELAVFVYCFIKRSYKELPIVGLFLILLPGALEYYGQVNQLTIDQKFHMFFLYVGLSHVFYGVSSSFGYGRQ